MMWGFIKLESGDRGQGLGKFVTWGGWGLPYTPLMRGYCFLSNVRGMDDKDTIPPN